jgi:hypothetical protein
VVLNVIFILALYYILFSFCLSVSLIHIKSIKKSFNLFYNTFYIFADIDFTNNYYLYYYAQVLHPVFGSFGIITLITFLARAS